MTVDSCFLVTEDTLIVNENDPGSVIYEEQDEFYYTTLEIECFSSYTELDIYMADLYQKKGGVKVYFFTIYNYCWLKKIY